MRTRLSFLGTAVILAATSARSAAAGGTGLEAEYAQVRKIALKDPKVQEAYEKANERLDAKILQIDPSLKPIVDRERRAPEPLPVQPRTAAAAHTPLHHFTPAPADAGREHVVVKGETVSSIAAHFKVKTATLEKVNHITNAKTLRVGQKLVIPAQSEAAARPSPAQSIENQQAKPPADTQSAPAKDGEGLWDKVKNSL